jgi:hypothetical protein
MKLKSRFSFIQLKQLLDISVLWDVTFCSPLEVNVYLKRNISPPYSGSKNNANEKPA